MDLLTLGSKPATEQFTEDEIKFLKKKLPKNRWRAKYAIYKPESSRGEKVSFLLDQESNAQRRSAVENSFEIICERELFPVEYDFVIGNFGTFTRRFRIEFYKTIDDLIDFEKAGKISTPEKFIDECVKRGFTRRQLKLEF